jgi:hypothetical protein
MPIRWHVDDPDLLRQAIEYTARQTGFSLRLIEKDYFCSVVLEYRFAGPSSRLYLDIVRAAGGQGYDRDARQHRGALPTRPVSSGDSDPPASDPETAAARSGMDRGVSPLGGSPVDRGPEPEALTTAFDSRRDAIIDIPSDAMDINSCRRED